MIESPSLVEAVRAVMADEGGTANLSDLPDTVAAQYPDLFRHHVDRAWRNAIRQALTTKDGDGLPWAASVDNAGTYRQRALFDAADYRVVIARYVSQSQNARSIAYVLADECLRKTGDWIDPAELAA